MKRYLMTFVCLLTFSLAGADVMPSARLGSMSRMQVDSVLATINGDAVTLLDVILETAAQERILRSHYTGERLLSETRALRLAALEQILIRKLLYLKYKEKPFPVPPQEIENMLDALCRDFGVATRAELEEKFRPLGISMEKVRARAQEKLVTDAILYQLCDKTVTVTPKDVYDEYKAHPEAWSRPERINLQLIRISSEGGRMDSASRIETLRKSAFNVTFNEFHALAVKFSDAPNASEGGMTGYMSRDKLRPEFAEALKDAMVGQTVGPVTVPGETYFIRLCGVEKASLIPFASISASIEARLKENALREHRAEYIRALREKNVIRYYFEK